VHNQVTDNFQNRREIQGGNMHHLNAGFSRRAVHLLVVALVGLWALPARAADLSPKDQKQIIQVVQAQLNAFARDDAAKAFSYAAPNIRQLMGSAENFMAMVRTRYAVVYRPASTLFMQPSGHAAEALLEVQMTDADGDVWIASYTLQRQANKTWRITGCSVNQTTGTMV
jgi:hypothetical protein